MGRGSVGIAKRIFFFFFFFFLWEANIVSYFEPFAVIPECDNVLRSSYFFFFLLGKHAKVFAPGNAVHSFGHEVLHLLFAPPLAEKNSPHMNSNDFLGGCTLTGPASAPTLALTV